MSRTIGIVARRWRVLEPLLQAYAEEGWEILRLTSDPPAGEQLAALAEQIDALLVLGDRRRSPSTVLPGPLLWRRDGSPIPAGWLPDVGDEALGIFARCAARLHTRSKDQVPPPIAILSQWHPQYLRLALRIEQLLENQGMPVFRWTSDIVYREDMARGLRSGLAAAVYVGHGRPAGWVGYYGTRIHHLQTGQGEALGALLSLCCRTASRRRTSLSFAEAVPLMGIAGAAFGAIGPTAHTDNTRWSVGLCAALGKGVRTVGEWIASAAPTSSQACASYRLLGDPVSPLLAADSALERASTIPIYP
jgi:hypothetical protein